MIERTSYAVLDLDPPQGAVVELHVFKEDYSDFYESENFSPARFFAPTSSSDCCEEGTPLEGTLPLHNSYRE